MRSKHRLSKKEIEWIGIRMLDTNSNTFLYDGKYYKAILPSAESYIKDAKYCHFLNALHAENFIPKTELCDFEVDGFLHVYSQHTEYFQVHMKNSNPFVLKEAALLYIRLNLWLYKRGFIVFDGHASNMVIQKLDSPYWCDIGSFKTLTKDNELDGIDEFIRYYIYPLLLRSKCFSLGDMMRFGISKGINHDVAKVLGLVGHLKFSTWTRASIFQTLEALVTSIDFPWEKTLWSDYAVRAHDDATQQDTAQLGAHRKDMITRILKILAPKTLIDLGANAGTFSRLAANLGIEVLALEPDETAVARGHMYLREFGAASPVKFVSSDVFQIHQSADVAMALALSHHIFLSSQYPWKYIAKIFAAHTHKHLITEFMPNGLGGLQKQGNLPAQYTLENFVKELQNHFSSVEIIDYLHSEDVSPRILLLCTHKK